MFPTSFPDKEVISTITAKMLIEVEAVRFSSGEPFKFTSGWASPVYIDCRKLISYPRVRHTLMDFAYMLTDCIHMYIYIYIYTYCIV